MKRLLATPLLVAFLLGCHGRPVNVLTRGAMNFGGKMDMTGDMKMSGNLTTSLRNDNTASTLSRVIVSGNPSAPRAIAVVGVDDLLVNRNLGGIGSMGENPVALFREKLQTLARDPTIAAIVLRIDTPGGGVNASDLMGNELRRFSLRRNVPIIACIMSVGAGGGYYLASHADHIVAQSTSIVGGIGVILNIYNLEDTLGQFNVVSVPIKSGEKIDIASPQRMMDEDEREVLQGIADAMHQRFIAQVVESRAGIDEASELFDGRVVTGTQALEQSLIDRIGYLDDAIDTARQMAQLDEEVAVVMLRRDNDRAYTVMDKTPNTPSATSLIPLNIPGLDRSSLPTFLYLWQADPRFITASGG